MIVLTTTSQSLRVTATDVTSSALEITAVYFDQLQQHTDALQRRTHQMMSTSTTAARIAVEAPAVDTIIRNIEAFAAYNGTATTATPEVSIVGGSGGAPTQRLVKQALLSGESLVYEHGTGWTVI